MKDQFKTAHLSFAGCKENSENRDNYNKVGINTGNMVFAHALRNLFKVEPITSDRIYSEAWRFSRIIVRDFIWIQEGKEYSYFYNLLKLL